MWTDRPTNRQTDENEHKSLPHLIAGRNLTQKWTNLSKKEQDKNYQCNHKFIRPFTLKKEA